MEKKKIFLHEFDTWIKQKYGVKNGRTELSKRSGISYGRLTNIINGSDLAGKSWAYMLSEITGGSFSELYFLYPGTYTPGGEKICKK